MMPEVMHPSGCRVQPFQYRDPTFCFHNEPKYALLTQHHAQNVIGCQAGGVVLVVPEISEAPGFPLPFMDSAIVSGQPHIVLFVLQDIPDEIGKDRIRMGNVFLVCLEPVAVIAVKAIGGSTPEKAEVILMDLIERHTHSVFWPEVPPLLQGLAERKNRERENEQQRQSPSLLFPYFFTQWTSFTLEFLME